MNLLRQARGLTFTQLSTLMPCRSPRAPGPMPRRRDEITTLLNLGTKNECCIWFRFANTNETIYSLKIKRVLELKGYLFWIGDRATHYRVSAIVITCKLWQSIEGYGLLNGARYASIFNRPLLWYIGIVNELSPWYLRQFQSRRICKNIFIYKKYHVFTYIRAFIH